jgi:predicted regulator of Ras-like GTPase activity (Roadblock/LC7/MglB family)
VSTPLSAEARNLNWLVTSFADRVPGVTEAAVVSSDGLLIALSDGLDRSSGDRLAAVAAGLLSIAKGAAAPIGGGKVHEVIVEMDSAMLFVMRVSATSVLAVTATRPCDVGLVGYEMAVLVDRAAPALTPALVSELQTALPRSAIR